MEDEDPFTTIWEGPTTEAAPRLRALERSSIPVANEAAALPGHTRIEVPRSYVAEAYAAIELAVADTAVVPDSVVVPDTPAELFDTPAPPENDDDEDDRPLGGGMSMFGSPFVVAFIAVVLIAAILLTLRYG